MSDENRRAEHEEPEVEGHSRRAANDEPAEDGEENEVEGHIRRAAPKKLQPKKL
jgi:hypothetical protein